MRGLWPTHVKIIFWNLTIDKNPEEPPDQVNIKNQDSYFEELLKKPSLHDKASQNLHPKHKNKKPQHHAAANKQVPKNSTESQLPNETVAPRIGNKPEKPQESPSMDDSAISKGEDSLTEILNGSKPQEHSDKKSNVNQATPLETPGKANKQTDDPKQKTPEEIAKTESGRIPNKKI